MINRVVLTGRLTREPELRTTGGGLSVCAFTLAVNRQFTKHDGEREADFINCVIWRKAAENFANFTTRGSLVGIDGRLQTRSYEDKSGKRVFVTEVIVDQFSLLESRKQRMEQEQAPALQPVQLAQAQADPFQDSKANSVDISADDLPF
jgi:single-strand DNA-binding protein